MATNYTPIGWDSTKYINPTNMNQMDAGIKAACDGVDRLDGEVSAVNENLGKKVSKSGDTMSGDLKVAQSSANANVVVSSPARQISLAAQNEANGSKAGLWDATNGKWILHSDTEGNVYVNGANLNSDLSNYLPKSGGDLTGDVRIDKTTSTDTARMSVVSKTKELRLIAEQGGTCGLYDATNGKYLVMEDTEGNVLINGANLNSELGAVQIKQIQLVTTNNISVSGTNNVSVTVDISGYKFTGTVRAFLKANKYCTGHADVSADKKTLTVECYGVGVDTSNAQLSFYLVETNA